MQLKSLFLLAIGALSAVIEATDKDIDVYLNNGVPMILDLYATWCSHCKSFSPHFDTLASEFEHLGDKIQFVKVNVDKNRKSSKRFDIQYVPTIKYIHGEISEEIDSRDPADIKAVIKEKLSITPESRNSEKPSRKVSREYQESHVVQLVDDTFKDVTKGKHVLIAFTTTWCPHCGSLAPQWEQLAKIYGNDDNIVIANVDCTDESISQHLMRSLEVDAFPTIVYVPDHPTEENLPKKYKGPRDVNGFIEFIKDLGISNRESDGSLNDKAGVIPNLDLSVLPDFSALLSQVKKSGSKEAALYEKILTKASANANYLKSEAERLTSLLKNNLKPSDRDTMTRKLNILKSLLDASDVKQEL